MQIIISLLIQLRIFFFSCISKTVQVALVVKNLLATAGDAREAGSIPGSGRSPGGGHGNPLQYSYLENPMDRRAWQAMVHGITKSWTQLSTLAHTVAIKGIPEN